jgi:hypothetical protein
MDETPILYVGCGLTNAPEEFKGFVTALKAELRVEGYEVLEFVGLKGGTPLDVWNYDLKNVDTCTHFIAVVDESSTGLGIEMGRALWHAKKPLLCMHRQGAKVTRMIPGGRDAGAYAWAAYTNLDDAVALVKVFIIANPLPVPVAVAAE